MGTATETRISGDNDAPIHPVRYIMYHLYCDSCGSFALDYWMEPDNHAQLQEMAQRLRRIAWWAAAATVVSVIGAVFGLIFFLIPALIVLAGAWIGAALLERRIVTRGARCRDCGATYAYDSGFFSDYERNPRSYTAADIPPPAGQGIRITGPILGPATE